MKIRVISFYLSFLLIFIFSSSISATTLSEQSEKEPITSKQNVSVVYLVHKSREQVAANNFNAALKYARAAVAVDPAYYEAWKQLGRVLMLRGDYADALNSFQIVLDLKADDPEVQGWILRSLLAEDRIKELIKSLETLQDVTISQLDNKIITELLERLFDKSDFIQAEKIAALWEKKAPQAGARLAAKGLQQLIKNNHEEAEKILSETDTTVRDTRAIIALAWMRLGIRLLERNEPSKAVTVLQKSLELQPDWIPALRELGWAYRRAGQPAQAADTWNHGFQKNSHLITWLLWIAEARIETGQLQDALTAIEHLLKSEPKNNRGLALKLMLLVLQNKNDDVKKYEQQLKKLPEGDYIVALGRTFADRHAGRFNDAATRLEGLLQSHPDDTDIKEMLADTYAGWASTTSVKEALYPLQKLVSLKPTAGAWRDLGWSLWSNGQHEEAINAWDQAIRNKITDRERLIHQVVARLVEEGYGKKTIEFYKKWNPDSSYLPLGISLMEGRHYVASREILLAAWDAKENLPVTGLYLGYVEANLYICPSLPDHFHPFIERGITGVNEKEIDILIEATFKCSSDVSILQLINKIETMLNAFPEYAHDVTEILEKSADAHYFERDLEKAFNLYHRILKRDPNRANTWLRLMTIAKEIGRDEEAKDILKDVLLRSSSPSVREGIQGKLSAESGNAADAIDHYQRSIINDPNQPELRFELFNLLISLERYDEGRKETKWFSERVSAGDSSVMSYFAEMLSSLQELEAALKIWQDLHLSYPEIPHYAIETARAMFYLCRAEEAISILEQFVAIKPSPRAYELLAEIEAARGNAERAFYWTEEAKSLQPTAGLLRIRSEVAESLGKPIIAQEAAEALLQSDLGNVPVARIAGKAILSQGLTERAKNYYVDLLNHNPLFLPSLIHLIGIAYDQKQPDQALTYTKQIVDQRPWDMHAHLRNAISLAVKEKFKPSLKFLREQVKNDPMLGAPLLIYSDVTQCPYAGRNTTRQIIAHINHLNDQGYQFIAPFELSKPAEQPRVIIVIANPEPAALPALDSVLQKNGDRAILAVHNGALITHVPGNPKPEILKEMQESGRWIIALSGPARFQRITVNETGTLGNPLTHKWCSKTKWEDDNAFSERLNKSLYDASVSLSSPQSRIFLYPGGDYGHLSLDTDPQTLKILYSTIQRYFDFAIAADDSGHVPSQFDPFRLPGRFVPPHWDVQELTDHLHHNNPYVQARLELAKVLYWQKQHERANKWFRIAKSLGADPKEVNLHWGNNAYQEGDLPVALEKLRKAHELDSASIRILNSLERAENRKRLLLKLNYRGWDDSDDESYRRSGGSLEAYIHDRLQLELFTDRNKWARKGFGSEKGTRIGGGLLWHFAEGYRVDARIWHMSLDRIDDHWGGIIRVHVPNAPFGGYVELEAAREEIDFVEAVRKEILANRYELNTYSRIGDEWDLYADFYYMNRTDKNDTLFLDGRLVYRLHEWPFLGLGYAFRFADSDRKPPEYWAPKGLQQHQLYAATLGEYKGFHYSWSLRAGYAQEDETNWRFVWGTRLILDYMFFSRLTLTGEINYLETPTYDRTAWLLGIKFRF